MHLKTDNLGAPTIALLAMAALASAMGVGRFAFTPLMPLMQVHGTLSFEQGAWLAGANYCGYLVGALACIARPPEPQRAARAAMVAVAVLTLAMGMTARVELWLVLRFAAGVASAYVLVSVSAWALPALGRLGHSDWAGWVFAGVGIGIAAVGAVGLAAGMARIEPAPLWVVLGAASAVVSALSWSPMRRRGIRVSAVAQSHVRFRASEWRLILCYGIFGFGYIIPATFLPAMAREMVDDPAVFGWAWPVFGAVAAVSTILASRTLRYWSPRRLWIPALLIMTVGVLAPVFVRNVGSLLLAAVCVGGTFVVITMVGMLEARRYAGQAGKLMAAMTAAFATGQLLGPLAVGMLASQGIQSLTGPSLLAASGLLVSAWMLRHGASELPPSTKAQP
jgi:predicted MFS family arabinose efflux permease